MSNPTSGIAKVFVSIAVMGVLVALFFPFPATDQWLSDAENLAPPSREQSESRKRGALTSEIRSPETPSPYDEIATLFDIGYAGGVRVDEDLRVSLEAAVNVLGDQPAEADLQQFATILGGKFPYNDAQHMIELVRKYANYVQAIAAQVEPSGIPGNRVEANAMFDKIEALQNQYFDPAIKDAIFGLHDRHARLVAEASFVESDPNLPLEEKRRKLSELRSSLPTDQQLLIPQLPS